MNATPASASSVFGIADARTRLLLVLGSASLATVGVAYSLTGGATSAAVLAGTIVVSTSFIAAGAFAWNRRPANRTGALMMATGWTLLAGLIQGPPIPLLSPIGVLGGTISGVLLGYLILAFPAGELRSSSDRVFIIATAALLAATNLSRLAAFNPSTGSVDYVNPYQVLSDPALIALTIGVERAVTVTILLGFLIIVISRWAEASEPSRRILGPVLAPATVLFIAVIASVLADAVPVPATVKELLFVVQIVARAAIPIGFLAGLLRTRMARGAVADLVVELGAAPAPARLRDALAHALGDRTLEIAYWSPVSKRFVDSSGDPVTLPDEGSGKAVTRLDRDGMPLAAIVHDAALLEDSGLVASVASAMRLAVENERLQGEVEDQLAEGRASRARIVAAGDAERKRLERDLHDGAQQRLVALTLALRLARARLGETVDPEVEESLSDASDQAKAAIGELRELARGIHPQILTEAGLTGAVASLADRSPIPVDVENEVVRRFPATIEATAYFVISEALANVAKYANASRAVVRLTWADRQLTVEIVDDGIGGADPAAGSGLRGLVDRLSALDGTLEVTSPTRGGTRLVARIPTPARGATEDIATA